MALVMNFGAITQRDIAAELASRGITVAPGEVAVITPPAVVTPPQAPDQPITILPRVPVDYYEPYIPVYPPAVVTPEDVTEEILPYIPGQRAPAEKKGLDKGLLIIIGITAFALMTLAKPKPGQGRARRGQYQRRRF